MLLMREARSAKKYQEMNAMLNIKELERKLENEKSAPVPPPPTALGLENEELASDRVPWTPHKQQDELEDNDLIDLYDALCVEDGQPVYLCDGVWLYPDGDVRDESGR
jgi:hypothetical protein